MKKIFYLLLLFSSVANAQWKQHNGLYDFTLGLKVDSLKTTYPPPVYVGTPQATAADTNGKFTVLPIYYINHSGLGRFGLNVGTPLSILHLETSNIDTFFRASKTGVNKFIIGNNGDIFSNSLSGTGQRNLVTDASGNVTASADIIVRHIQGSGSAPSVVVGSSVTGTVSIVGNDLGGTVTLVVTSSTTLSTLAELFTLTFTTAYGSTPNVVFSPANGAAVGNIPTPYVKGTSTTGFSIATANSIASLPATTYIWTYRVSN